MGFNRNRNGQMEGRKMFDKNKPRFGNTNRPSHPFKKGNNHKGWRNPKQSNHGCKNKMPKKDF